MLRIGKMADYALLITNKLVVSSEKLCTTDELVEATKLPTATVRKLLKKLVDAKIVISHRGAKGGYNLANNPIDFTIADVIVAIEGPISLTQCATHHAGCDLLSTCELKTNWSFLNEMVVSFFQHITLEDMSANMSQRKIQFPISNVVGSSQR